MCLVCSKIQPTNSCDAPVVERMFFFVVRQPSTFQENTVVPTKGHWHKSFQKMQAMQLGPCTCKHGVLNHGDASPSAADCGAAWHRVHISNYGIQIVLAQDPDPDGPRSSSNSGPYLHRVLRSHKTSLATATQLFCYRSSRPAG